MKRNIKTMTLALAIAVAGSALASVGTSTPANKNIGVEKGIQYTTGNPAYLLGTWYEITCDGKTNVWVTVVPGASNGVGTAHPFNHGCGTSNEK